MSIMAAVALSYLLAAIACDDTAHGIIYHVVGNGYPLTGRRRWAVALFSPFILIGIACWCLPIAAVVILAMTRR